MSERVIECRKFDSSALNHCTFLYRIQNQRTESDEQSKDPVKVFVLSYQRTGSTFIGGIFNDFKNMFNIYEPVDPLYSAMYVIEDGWTVPNDIFNNVNGSLRYV